MDGNGERVQDLASAQPLSIVDALTGAKLEGYTSDPNILGGADPEGHGPGLLGMPIVATRDSGGGWLYVRDPDGPMRRAGAEFRCIVVTR